MLADAQHFDKIEKILRDNGSIEKFERECGEVLGRVMITLGEVPANLDIVVPEGSYAFICTFDFYDCSLGLVLNPYTKKPEVAYGLLLKRKMILNLQRRIGLSFSLGPY